MPKQRQPVELLTGILRHLLHDLTTYKHSNRRLVVAASMCHKQVKNLRETHPAYTPKRKVHKPKPLLF